MLCFTAAEFTDASGAFSLPLHSPVIPQFTFGLAWNGLLQFSQQPGRILGTYFSSFLQVFLHSSKRSACFFPPVCFFQLKCWKVLKLNSGCKYERKGRGEVSANDILDLFFSPVFLFFRGKVLSVWKAAFRYVSSEKVLFASLVEPWKSLKRGWNAGAPPPRRRRLRRERTATQCSFTSGVFSDAERQHLCLMCFCKNPKEKRFIVVCERAFLQIPPAWISRVTAVICLPAAFEG